MNEEVEKNTQYSTLNIKREKRRFCNELKILTIDN